MTAKTIYELIGVDSKSYVEYVKSCHAVKIAYEFGGSSDLFIKLHESS